MAKAIRRSIRVAIGVCRERARRRTLASQSRGSHRPAQNPPRRAKPPMACSSTRVFDRMFRDALLDAIARRRSFHGPSSEIVMVPAKNFRQAARSGQCPVGARLTKKEQSNTSITYGDRLILKLFRRLQEGVNPDLEISRFITEKTEYPHTPTLGGVYRIPQRTRMPAPSGHSPKLGKKRRGRMDLHPGDSRPTILSIA